MNWTSSQPETRSVLLVDDDAARASGLRRLLQFMDYPTEVMTGDALCAQDKLSGSAYCAVIAGEDPRIRDTLVAFNRRSHCPLVMLMAPDSVSVEPAKPWLCALPANPDFTTLSRVLDRIALHWQTRQTPDDSLCQPFIGGSAQVSSINQMIAQVADTTASVLILGESGTGKEVIARNIHARSGRRDQPFIPINCGAIPAELLESELFGHEKGAFTGAISARQGRFELAEGGVIFLDEIGDMPLSMQVKILRVLQERCFERVGGNRSIQTDVRVIAATHRNLEQSIEQGQFREDLYYRLNVFPIEVPPLRQRREDIGLLLDEMIRRIERDKRGSVRLASAARRMLSAYDWPGNVRELANLVERLAILYPHDVVDVRQLPAKFLADGGDPGNALAAQDPADSADCMQPAAPGLPSEGLDLKQHLADIEIGLIEQALAASNNVVARAANLLHMRRTTLVEKMRKYGIDR